MTTPAPSPKEPAKRSRHIYIYWGVALSLLLALGLFCWLVVVPYLQVRASLARYEGSTAPDRAEAEFERLGRPKRAIRSLVFYLRLPTRWAPRQSTAVDALSAICGRSFWPDDGSARPTRLGRRLGLGGAQKNVDDWWEREGKAKYGR